MNNQQEVQSKSRGMWLAFCIGTIVLAGGVIILGVNQGWFGSDSSSTSIDPNQPVTTIIIPVDGMTCSSCEKLLEHNIKKLEGVTTVKASHTTKQVTVVLTHNAPTSAKNIRTTISQLSNGQYVVKQ